jgi:hypothetical protein
MSPISDPWFYLLAIPAVAIFGIAKSGFGGSFGILAVPLLALVIAPTDAAAIMLPLLVAMDLLGLHMFRGKADPANLRILIPAGVVGIVLGVATFSFTSDRWLRAIIGAIALAFVAQRAWAMVRGGDPPARRASRMRGSFWGVLSGYTSFIANAGGPPLIVYLAPQRLEQTAFAATTVFFFAAINAVKLVPFLWLGLFDARNLATSAVLLPLVPLGYAAGLWMLRAIDPRRFYHVITAALALTGAKLVWDAAVAAA